MERLMRVMEEWGIDEHEAISLLKDGIQKRKEREQMRVREKERREFAKQALEYYKKQKGLS